MNSNSTNENKLWESNILYSLRAMADFAKQKEIWLGKSSEYASSYVEDISTLFDSFCFDDFVTDLNWAETDLSKNLQKKLIEVRDMLVNYHEKETDEEILEDSQWKYICERISDAVDFWDTESKHLNK